jgi:hypothetical protein
MLNLGSCVIEFNSVRDKVVDAKPALFDDPENLQDAEFA